MISKDQLVDDIKSIKWSMISEDGLVNDIKSMERALISIRVEWSMISTVWLIISRV